MSANIKNLANLSDDPKKLQEIGHRLVVQAIENEVAERLGEKIATPMVVRHVTPGSVVPSDLRGEPGLQVDAQTLTANTGWEKTWLNLGLWDRNWSENETGAAARFPSGALGDVRLRLQLENVLTAQELQIVDKLKIADRLGNRR